jgi:F-type H+-transporting ATPase subunit b
VVVLLERPVARFAKTALTKRRDDIADQLAQAEKLQDDAQHLWADYERKFVNAEQEAADILKNSQKQIERNFEEETRKFDNEYLRKSNDAQRIMKSAQDHLLDDINEQASQKAVQTAVRYLKRTLDDKRQTALIDESIDHILQELQH